jgi:hypothetical protein
LPAEENFLLAAQSFTGTPAVQYWAVGIAVGIERVKDGGELRRMMAGGR